MGSDSVLGEDPSIGLRTINAKAETITTAPAFREAIKYRPVLCLLMPFTNGRSLMQQAAVCYRDEGQPTRMPWLAYGRSGRIGKQEQSC